MNAAAGRMTQAVVLATLLASSVTGIALAVVLPHFFLVDDALIHRIMLRSVVVAIAVVILLCIMAYYRMYCHRFTLRALGLGSQTVEPDSLIALSEEPLAITLRGLGVVLIAALLSLIPVNNSTQLDWDTSIAMMLVSLSFSSTAALALHSFIRRRVSKALMLASEDTMREAIERMLEQDRMSHYTVFRILITVLVPVALVGFNAALIVHGHVRAFEARERQATAIALARSSLEPIPAPVTTAGESAAVRNAEQSGYSVQLYNTEASFKVRHIGTDRAVITVPLKLGHATISFRQTTVLAVTASAFIAALIASLCVAIIGLRVGKILSDDLAHAHRQVRMLGTDKVMQGSASVARPARFDAVIRLGIAIEKLAERFRVFAAAQEKAIIAKDAIRRMRGLLFASVSHDLKGSLNAVLGFADLIDNKQLTQAQAESIYVIRSRARELLGLIRTILDGARVDAGQLTITKQPTLLTDILQQAIAQSKEQIIGNNSIVYLDPPSVSWLINVDADHFTDALRSWICHGIKMSNTGKLHVNLAKTPLQDSILIDIEIQTQQITAIEMQQLLQADGISKLPGAKGGLGLELSLARSLMQLNGATLQAIESPEGMILRIFIKEHNELPPLSIVI